MKFPAACIAMVALWFAPQLGAQTPEDRYVEVYSWIEEANQLVTEGQQRLAVERYEEAQAGLKDLQRLYPTWNTNIVRFRLSDIGARLAALAPSRADGATGNPRRLGSGTNDPVGASPGNDAQQLRQEVARLKAQNARLEARLREALSVQPAAADPRQLDKFRERLQKLEKERDLLAASLEEERSKGVRPAGLRAESNGSLEVQLKAALAAARSAQAERDALASRLEKVSQELEKATLQLQRPGDRGSIQPGGNDGAGLDAIRTRRAAYEIMPVGFAAEPSVFAPVTPILLAAVGDPPIPRTAPVSTNNAGTNRVPARKKYELPAGSGALFADVERAVDAGRYAEAEKKLRDILRQDENNVRLLDKLAAVLMDQGKVGEAETTLKKSLSIDAEDPAALYMLGSLKLRQDKTDEALEMLKLSARIEPEMPQTQYFLGQALIQKGDRSAAENALRRAIQLKPNWGEPHYLLAVLYGTEEPTFRELARFHYKKAIAGGATRNPALEKRIDSGGAGPKP